MSEEQGTLFQADCPHAHKIVVAEKRGPHHAKLICKHCRKFMGWVPKPETVRQRQENERILTALSKMKDLPSWERQFVRQVSAIKNLSPRQQEKLLQLRDVLLGKEFANDSFNGEAMSPDRDVSNNL
jgi:hypothetical protein